MTSMGMIGYALIHVREHERSEGITPLDEREKYHRPLDQWTEKCMAIPRWNNVFHYLSERFSVTGISRKELECIRMTCSMSYTNSDI